MTVESGHGHGEHLVRESKKAVYLFPIAFLLNASSMTLLLIGAGLAGRVEFAADIAIVQGASLAVFYAFSANSRNIILRETSRISWQQVLRARVMLMLPLAAAAVLICLYVTNVAPVLVVIMVIRRCSEWISEISLARAEREGSHQSAQRFIGIQSVLLVVAMAAAIGNFEYTDIGLLLWAVVPLLLSGKFLGRNFRLVGRSEFEWIQMLPHFGSTAITGITVFVFRLVILLLVDKSYAGNLFTAFALGGIFGSVFAQALGPTLVFHSRKGQANDTPTWLTACLVGNAVVGSVILVASATEWQFLAAIGKPLVFWSAIGASMIGGSVMVIAQAMRLRLLQHHEDSESFGPDVLTNIFIVACVPYVYYLLGVDALSWLFFLNAAIAVVFYASAGRTVSSDRESAIVDRPAFRQAVAAGLLFPVFFQLAGKLFSDEFPLLDSGGDLLNLPIPVSVLICYGAIVVIGNFERARMSLTTIFSCFCLMLLSTVLSTHGYAGLQEAKIILLIQLILPMLALVLGQTFEGTPSAEGNIAKAYFYVLVLVVPLQLGATLIQNLPLLSSYLYVFSIYQHLQYVPMMFVCAFVICCFSLWTDSAYRILLVILAIPIGAYVTLSPSMLTVGGVVFGAITFVAYQYWRYSGKRWKGPLLLLLLIGLGAYGIVPVVEKSLHDQGMNGTFLEMQRTVQTGEVEISVTRKDIVTRNMATRVAAWRFFVEAIANSGSVLLLGHETPPDRKRYPSAHNYYLDFVYNFGLLALVPIGWLVAYTMWKCVRHWKVITANPEFFALAGTVVFLLIVDNSLKVGMRQPYPGIITFFLWGVLLSRLGDIRKEAEGSVFEK